MNGKFVNFTRTKRGFAIGEFIDLYENKCSIQKSSLATVDAIWLGVDDAEPRVLASQAEQLGVKTDKTTGWVPFPIPSGVDFTTRMHLSRDQVVELLPVLSYFATNGNLPASSQPTQNNEDLTEGETVPAFTDYATDTWPEEITDTDETFLLRKVKWDSSGREADFVVMRKETYDYARVRVNACAGCDTKTLSAMANGEMTGSEIWELAKVKQQRDELLAKINAANEAVEAFAKRITGADHFANSPCQAHPLEIVELWLQDKFNRDKQKNSQLLAALTEIANWVDKYTSAGHPVSTIARQAIANAGEA